MSSSTTTADAAGTSLGALLRDLWGFDRRAVLTVGALATGSAASEGVGIVLLVPLLTRIDDRGDLQTSSALVVLLGAFVLLVGLRALLVRTHRVAAESLRLRWVDDARVRAFRALTEADLGFVVRERPSDIVQVLGGEMARLGMLVDSVTSSAVRALVVLGAVVAGVVVAPGPTAVALVTGAVTALVSWPMVKRSRALGTALTGRAREHLAVTTGFVDGVRQSKAHGAEQVHVDAYVAGAADVRDSMLEHQRAQASLSAVQQLFGALALAAIVAVSVRGFGLDVARLVPVLAITGRVVMSVSPLSSSAQRIAHMLPAHAAVADFVARADAAREAPAVGDPVPFERSIELDAVAFAHRDGPRVEVGSLRIAAGTTVALVGPSGSGKSTTIDLIAGLFAPSEGAVAVDGVVLDDVARRAWRSSVALVSQHPLIAPGTVRENVVWGSEADDESIWSALAAAHVDDVVRALPAGLDTVLARDAGLSGGERQRLNLARALLRRPRLLLLDEPTSSLDAPTAALVADTVARLSGVTVVIATHQPGLFAVDAVVEIGRVGGHEVVE